MGGIGSHGISRGITAGRPKATAPASRGERRGDEGSRLLAGYGGREGERERREERWRDSRAMLQPVQLLPVQPRGGSPAKNNTMFKGYLF